MNDLNPIHRQTLDFIRRFIEDEGYPPTIRDMLGSGGLGVTSLSTVKGRLDVLEDAGYIERRGPRKIITITEEAQR